MAGEMRAQVLAMYRKLLKTARTWKSPEDALYIRNETRLLFHKNRDLQDKEVIKEKLFEAQSRYELALHYGIPQPRYYNVSPKTHNATVGKKRAKAAYLDSYYEDSSNTT